MQNVVRGEELIEDLEIPLIERFEVSPLCRLVVLRAFRCLTAPASPASRVAACQVHAVVMRRSQSPRTYLANPVLRICPLNAASIMPG